MLPVALTGEHIVDLVRRHPIARVMRTSGLDCFEPATEHFATVELVRSDPVDTRFQPFVHCPDESLPMPLRHRQDVFVDVVPVCRA